MYIIPKWWEQSRKCADCGTDKGVRFWDVVKYPQVSRVEPSYCHRCMTIRNAR